MGCATGPSQEAPVARLAEPLEFSTGQVLKATQPSQVGAFGTAVAVSRGTAIVGAADINAKGSAYVFERTGDEWALTQRLGASDAQKGGEFGVTVALDDDTALIGARRDAAMGHSGAVYVFAREDSSFSEVQKLKASVDEEGASFGRAVALDADTALVGATDAVYLFVNDGGTWQARERILVDVAPETEFGRAVALDGDTAIIGSYGNAWVYTRQGTDFVPQQTLFASDGENQYFGTAVAVSGDFALIGARLDATNDLSHAGNAYLFHLEGTTWTEVQKLTGEAGDWFGDAVALSGDLAIVGADYDAPGGSATVFLRGDQRWNKVAKFADDDGQNGDSFGRAVAIGEQAAIVGASGKRVDGFGQAGLAYVYSLPEPIGSGGSTGMDPPVEDPPADAGAPGTGETPATTGAAGTSSGGSGGAKPNAKAGAAGAVFGASGEGVDDPGPATTTGGGGQAGEEAAPCQGDSKPCTPARTSTTTEGGWGFGCSTSRASRRASSPAWAYFCVLLLVGTLRARKRRSQSASSVCV
jgi:hypothetical protein